MKNRIRGFITGFRGMRGCVRDKLNWIFVVPSGLRAVPSCFRALVNRVRELPSRVFPTPTDVPGMASSLRGQPSGIFVAPSHLFAMPSGIFAETSGVFAMARKTRIAENRPILEGDRIRPIPPYDFHAPSTLAVGILEIEARVNDAQADCGSPPPSAVRLCLTGCCPRNS
jgi:hypothetical protein